MNIQGWEEKTIGEVLILQRGFDLPASNRVYGNIPVFGSNGVDSYHNKNKLSGKSIITGRSGTIGEVYYYDGDCWPLNTTLFVKDFCGNDEKFLSFLLKFIDLKKFSISTGVPTLNRNYVHPHLIHLPTSLEEQRKIAAVLSKVDEAIEQTRALIAKNEQIKTGLMQDLLTRGIDENGTIRSQQTHAFKDSPLGRIPVEWEVKTIGEVAEVKGGKRLPYGHDFTDTDSPTAYIRVTDLSRGSVNINNLKYISSETEFLIKNYKIYEDDVYISIAGTIGLVGKIPKKLNGSNLTENAAKITNISEAINSDFLSIALRSDNVQIQIDAFAGSAVQPKLALFRIKSIEIYFPISIEEQQKIAEILFKADEELDQYRAELSKLELLKSGLMQDLLSGKVRVA